jgi:uncharacterized protein YigE (DUF2233 family)
MRRPLLAFLLTLLPAVSLASGSSGACTLHVFEGSSFVACRFDSRKDELRLVLTDPRGVPLRSLSRLSTTLGQDRTRVRFAMNAGMYGTDGRPIGLYVERGRTMHALNTRDAGGNFYLKPNGVFSLDADGTMRIETTEAFAARGGSPVFATQSGPMLLIDGKVHPQISPDGPSKNIRNGVGVTGTYEAVFVISNEPVSFGRFARLFRDKLNCRDALFFDGTISSAWIPEMKRLDHGAALGPMVVVLAR